MTETLTTVRFTNEYDKTLLKLILTEDVWYIENGDEYTRDTLISLDDLVTLKDDLEAWIEQKKKEGHG